MLRQEDAIRVVCPAGTSLPDVIGTKALRQISAACRAAKVFDEPAHVKKSDIQGVLSPAVRMTKRSAAMTVRLADRQPDHAWPA
jgi:hypothetical protein